MSAKDLKIKQASERAARIREFRERTIASRVPAHSTEGMSEKQLESAGLRYNGYQEGCGEISGGHLYTRLEDPRTTFMVGFRETVAEAHARALIPFGIELVA